MTPATLFRKARSGGAVLLALALAACGGGGGIDGTGGGGGGTPGGNGVAYGTITAFGSIWVNGVEYSTSGATIRIDDRGGSESELRVGMLVRVDGSIANRTATTVTVDEAIKGRVEQKLDANRWLVMGQTVQIDNNTAFDNGIVPAVGDFVHVHGLVVGNGTVAAGFIERKATPGTPPFAVKGLVAGHDTTAQSFSIGGLVVRYNGATVNDMPAGSWNGLSVEVKGSTCAGNPVCGTLTATQVEPNGPRVNAADAAEFEGFVTALTANGFALGSQQVVVTPNTRFENGLAAELAVGTKVEAEGSIAGGVLTATKVSFRDNARLEGNIASINGNAITLTGLPGITVQATSLAKLGGGLTSVSNLAVGNHLRLRGRAGAGNSVFATELELRSTSPDPRVELRAPVASVANPTITLLGVAVDTSTIADNNFKDRNDAPIGRAAFFAAATVGQPVKVRATLVGATPRWDEAELED